MNDYRFAEYSLGRLRITWRKVPKYIGEWKTSSPSYLRVWLGSRLLATVDVPKFGRIS